MCGLDWYYGFMRRHRQLTPRTPEQTSLNRTKSFNKENVQLFFRNLVSTLSEYPNGSGCMKQLEFTKYIHFFIDKTKASKESPKLLLIDNHSSHISIEALHLANKYGTTLLWFPPHCSHRLQPLDVSVYGPVKNFYKSQCNAWQKNNAGKYLDIRHIPGLVRSTLDLALTSKNIKAGFCATGIAPYTIRIFLLIQILYKSC